MVSRRLPRDPISAESNGHVPKSYGAGLGATSLKGKRIGVLRQIVPADNADPRVVALMDKAIADLRKAGATIVDPLGIPTLPALTKDWQGFTRLRDDFDGYLAKHPNAPYKSFKEVVASKRFLAPRFESAFTSQANYAYSADADPGTPAKLQRSEEIRQAFLKAFDAEKLDALIFPQFNFPPKKNGDTYTPLGRDQNLYSSVTGFPALVVPMGFVDPGLPIGLQIFGRPWSESTLFEIGYGFEQATHHRVPPPTAPPLKDSFAAKFIGTWKLVEIRDRDPATGTERPAARGADDGQLVYAANGRLSVQIVRTGRERLTAASADGFSSYFGRWELLPAEGCVVHHQDAHVNPASKGQAAKRYYGFDAQGHLSLTTPPTKRDDGSTMQTVFVWERIG
ncbi:MAG: amidase family protein [Steroidobacteraceae bacterium]